jgi:acyl-CoA reductase-like NAD-dependent aldehyde dehydrogenase
MVIQINNFINNKYVSTENHIDGFNPSNGEIICKIPDSGKNEADMAIEAAKAAFESWSLTNFEYRAKILNKIADEVEKRLEEFAIAESNDQGKPLFYSLNIEIPRVVYNFRFFAAAILNHKNESTESFQNNMLNFTTQVPVGSH